MSSPKVALIALFLFVILAVLFTDCVPPDEPGAVKAEAKPKPEADKIIRDDLQQKRGS